MGDLDVHPGECVDGKREVSYSWSDKDDDGEPDCDPTNTFSLVKKLPPNDQEECHICAMGMSRDHHGNCKFCPEGWI